MEKKIVQNGINMNFEQFQSGIKTASKRIFDCF